MTNFYNTLDHVSVFPQTTGLGVNVLEAETVRLNRALLVDPNTALDMLACYHDGNRTGYYNEYGEIRSIAAKTNTTAARFKRRSSAASVNIVEVCDIDNTVLSAFDQNGRLIQPNDTWQALSYAANAADAGSTWYTAGCRLEPDGIVRLRGKVNFSGTFNSGVTFATLPSGFRPAGTQSFSIRSGGTGATGTFLDIAATTGAMSIRTNLGSGAEIHLDGWTFPVAAT